MGKEIEHSIKTHNIIEWLLGSIRKVGKRENFNTEALILNHPEDGQLSKTDILEELIEDLKYNIKDCVKHNESRLDGQARRCLIKELLEGHQKGKITDEYNFRLDEQLQCRLQKEIEEELEVEIKAYELEPDLYKEDFEIIDDDYRDFVKTSRIKLKMEIKQEVFKAEKYKCKENINSNLQKNH